MNIKVKEISDILHATACRLSTPEQEVLHLLTDSRSLTDTEGTVFFAIPTDKDSGTRYIDALYQAGVRSFVVPNDYSTDLPDINLWQVPDVVGALQAMAAHHRRQYDIPVVGITGSNGKTVVKDWLVQLLSPEQQIVANPKSYNSQIGVPLSVWQMNDSHSFALFEAGISQSGEMAALQRIIQPTIGLLTNIGQAHDENFASRQQKLDEKMQLFVDCRILICNGDQFHPQVPCFTWGEGAHNDVQLLASEVTESGTTFRLRHQGQEFSLSIPFIDHASQEDALHCIVLMRYLGYTPEAIAPRLARLAPVEMRLEINEAVGNSLLINDSYSLDLGSLTIALDFLSRQRRHPLRTLILSDIPQSGLPEEELYAQVSGLLSQKGIHRLIAVGPALQRQRQQFASLKGEFYATTEEMLAHLDPLSFRDQTVLLKGARAFRFERIAHALQSQTHQTQLEVNLDALIHNLNHYRSLLKPQTKLMAMVKASSYGAGSIEVANALQRHHVDYLTVAYADEGVTLRQGGIALPIMVMNPEPASFDDVIRYRLEPDIYSLRILRLFAEHYRLQEPNSVSPYPIHIEFDTGMHRLGFTPDDIPELQRFLQENASILHVQSIFSHLACADDPAMDDFTRRQISRLQEWSQRLKSDLPGPAPLVHILNTAGITRFTDAQMDMVRLGLGLYGVAPEPDQAGAQQKLRPVSRLITRISQIKSIPTGDTVGYNCRWTAQRPSRIAILTIGYADGLNRHLGRGAGHVLIHHHEAPIIGAICMDMCFVDVTDVPCAEGDTAVLFGEGDLLQRNAAAAGTIPYELLTAVSPRVKRVYFHEE